MLQTAEVQLRVVHTKAWRGDVARVRVTSTGLAAVNVAAGGERIASLRRFALRGVARVTRGAL